MVVPQTRPQQPVYCPRNSHSGLGSAPATTTAAVVVPQLLPLPQVVPQVFRGPPVGIVFGPVCMSGDGYFTSILAHLAPILGYGRSILELFASVRACFASIVDDRNDDLLTRIGV